MNEFDLIRTYLSPLAKDFPGSLNLLDDAAIIDVPAGKELVVTKDSISEGIHFLGTEEPALIAQKLLRTNLSDLAAKGATPLCYFVGALLPEGTEERWVADFAKGLAHDQQEFAIHLAGGDTAKTLGTLSLSLTAMGTVDKGAMLKRSDAQAGDDIYVSGTIGDATLGLMSLSGELNPSFERNDELEQRYFLPQPRIALGKRLHGIAHAAMDVSDGLVQDMGHICKASSIGATLNLGMLPLSKSAAGLIEKYPNLMEKIVGGGDDYELLFTAAPSKAAQIQTLSKELNVAITRIGHVTAGNSVTLLDEQEKPLAVKVSGWRHF